MRVLIAENEPIVRSALRLWLTEVLALEIIGEVGDMWTLFGYLNTVQPDVLILDMVLAGLALCGNLAQVLTAVRQVCPGLTVIGLSPTLNLVSSSSAIGIDALVSKLEPPDHLGQILQQMQGAVHSVDSSSPTPSDIA